MSYPPPSPPPGGGYPGAPQGGSGGYGSPPPPPGGNGFGSPPSGPGGYGSPQPPEKKSRTPMFIAIACAVLFVGAIVLGGGGFGAYLLLSGSDAEETTQVEDPTDEEPTSEDPTQDDPMPDPTDEPTTDPPTTEEPTADEPSVDPTESDLFSLTTGSPIALEELELDDGTVMTPTNGLYQGVYITLTNNHTEDIGLQYSNFYFYDTEGNVVDLAYAGATHNDGIVPPGETAEASLVVDAPAEVELESLVYRDLTATEFQEAIYPL